MSCAPVLALAAAPIADERPGTSSVLEMVADLVDAARSRRWSRFADQLLDLTGAAVVHVVAGDGVFRAGFAETGLAGSAGGAVEVLHPAPSVRVTLAFGGEASRAAAAPGIAAVERILLTTTWATAAGATPATPVASTIDGLPLSPRMREVAHLVVAGRSDKEIADALGVSHTSARSYVQRMCRSLGVSGRGGLLRLVVGEPAPPSAPRAARAAGHDVGAAVLSPPVGSARAAR